MGITRKASTLRVSMNERRLPMTRTYEPTLMVVVGGLKRSPRTTSARGFEESTARQTYSHFLED
jgi:hypothetical protein